MIQFYNTLTREKQPFEPIEPGHVKIYACGPTVFARAHLGLGRRIMVNDLLKRLLMARGFQVTHVMNITDLDDKTIAASAEAGEDIKEFTARYEKAFMEDLNALRGAPRRPLPSGLGARPGHAGNDSAACGRRLCL